MRWLRHAFAAVLDVMRLTARRMAAAKAMARKRRRYGRDPGAPPEIRPGAVAELAKAWRAAVAPVGADRFTAEAGTELGADQIHPVGQAGADGEAPSAVRTSAALLRLSSVAIDDAGQRIIRRIRLETDRLNRNNVTRTEAYRAFWMRHPDIHWALLAHMVSRNGGWNMTDLCGEWLPRLMSPAQRGALFRMLERSNALIFRDAYPQLLLLEESLRLEYDLTRLLPAFGVSRFMQPVWRQFLHTRDSAVLTTALIVNEQQVVERHVVAHPYYRERVIDKLYFRLQGLLQLNQIVFPYREAGGAPDGLRLIGLTIERFGDLDERIGCGKRLYAMLFDGSAAAAGVHRFARCTLHTGSRADYAPHLFTPHPGGPYGRPYRPRLDGLRLRPGAAPVYSPTLAVAWPDRPVKPPPPGDWFDPRRPPVRWFDPLPHPGDRDMTAVHAAGLNALERAAAAAGLLRPDDEPS